MPEDVKYAFRIRIASTLAGGYDEPGRRVSPRVRQEVVERDGGLCVFCGAPGAEIDHVAGPSAELTNLRLLCRDCHRRVTETHLVPLRPEHRERAIELLARIRALRPLHPCDAAEWATTWRQWRSRDPQAG
jgi:5-methylcytosine-specific restriction endonuclease McrA